MRAFCAAAGAVVILALSASAANAFPLYAAPGGLVTAVSTNVTLQASLLTLRCSAVAVSGPFDVGPIAAAGAAAELASGVAVCASPVTFNALPWPVEALALQISGGQLVGVTGKISGVSLSAGGCTFTGAIPVLLEQPVGSSQTMTVLATDARHPALTGSPAICGSLRVAAGATFAIGPVQTLSL